MNKYNCFFLLIALTLIISCNEDKNVIYEDADFKWSISIPSSFKKVSEKEWDKVKKKGKKEIESALDQSLNDEDAEKTIFAFKNGTFHTLESNYKVYNSSKSFLESNKEFNIVTYDAMEKAMPDTELDSMSSVQIINGLEFESFEVNLNYPNGKKLTAKNYRRLFGSKVFTINILYENEKIGKEIIHSILTSKIE